MVASCSAYGCSNRHKPDGSISFHSFPINNKELLSKWVRAVRRKNFTPTKFSVLCSIHFEKEDYLVRPGTYRPRLRENVVPTIFPGFPKHYQSKLKVKKKVREVSLRNEECAAKTSSVVPESPFKTEELSATREVAESSSVVPENPYKTEELSATREVAETSSVVPESLFKTEELSATREVGTHCEILPNKIHKMIQDYRRRIKTANQKLRRMNARIESLNSLFEEMKKRGMINADLEYVIRENFERNDCFEY